MENEIKKEIPEKQNNWMQVKTKKTIETAKAYASNYKKEDVKIEKKGNDYLVFIKKGIEIK